MKIAYIVACIIFCLALDGCRPSKSSDLKTINTQDTPTVLTSKNILDAPLTYHYLILNKNNVSLLRSITSQDTLNVLFALNRVDSLHLSSQDTLIVPDTFIADLRAYATFPSHLDELNTIHKIIIINIFLQDFGAYEHGKLIHWGPLSMGKETTPTPTGLFFTNWKSKRAISTDNPDWIMNWYFNLENTRGVSIHEYALPGYAASHACIRMLHSDAFWFYYWADQWILESDTKISAYGTPAIIFGQYPYGKQKPWLKLSDNKTTQFISKEEVLGVLQGHLSLILERQAQRDTLITNAKKQAKVN